MTAGDGGSGGGRDGPLALVLGQAGGPAGGVAPRDTRGARRVPREGAPASGLAVGAVNVLVLNDRGHLLMQRRPRDKENGGRWDKSVGGHVSAGEEFDTTAVRESGEELFDDPRSPRIRLARDHAEFDHLQRSEDPTRMVPLHPVGFQLALRAVRRAPYGSPLPVLRHLAVYPGRPSVPSQ